MLVGFLISYFLGEKDLLWDRLTGPWYTNTARQRQLVICSSTEIICICIFSLIPNVAKKKASYANLQQQTALG